MRAFPRCHHPAPSARLFFPSFSVLLVPRVGSGRTPCRLSQQRVPPTVHELIFFHCDEFALQRLLLCLGLSAVPTVHAVVPPNTAAEHLQKLAETLLTHPAKSTRLFVSGTCIRVVSSRLSSCWATRRSLSTAFSGIAHVQRIDATLVLPHVLLTFSRMTQRFMVSRSSTKARRRRPTYRKLSLARG